MPTPFTHETVEALIRRRIAVRRSARNAALSQLREALDVAPNETAGHAHEAAKAYSAIMELESLLEILAEDFEPSAAGAPRRPPEPCYVNPEDPRDACPGWGVYDVDRCTVHGDDCDCDGDDCSTLEVEACTECWCGVPDAPDDDYYQAHPVCQAALASERGDG